MTIAAAELASTTAQAAALACGTTRLARPITQAGHRRKLTSLPSPCDEAQRRTALHDVGDVIDSLDGSDARSSRLEGTADLGGSGA
jgi:hypothetical protein